MIRRPTNWPGRAPRRSTPRPVMTSDATPGASGMMRLMVVRPRNAGLTIPPTRLHRMMPVVAAYRAIHHQRAMLLLPRVVPLNSACGKASATAR